MPKLPFPPAGLKSSDQSIRAWAESIGKADASSFGTFGTDSGTIVATSAGDAIIVAGGEGINTLATGSNILISGENAAQNNKGIASFDGLDFTVTLGNVEINDSGIDHDQLTNYVANEHIDWTSTSSAFSTSGTAATGALTTTGNIIVTGTVDGRDVATDGTKLDGIEANATADQSDAEIKTAYENNADTNEFSDAEQTKLAGIETSATADQTNAEIKTAYEANADTNEFSDAEQTKLSGIETSADVTDEANVTDALDGATLTDMGTPASGDLVLIQDITDSSILKVAAFSEFGGAGSGDPDQNLWETITSDSGSVAANTVTDTLTIAGGEGIDTSVSGDTLTIAGEDASATNKGIVELATDAETVTGTSTSLVTTVDQQAWVFLNQLTASSSASLDFAGLGSRYVAFKFILDDIVTATDGADLLLRTSTDGGSSFSSGSTDYTWSYNLTYVGSATAAANLPAGDWEDVAIRIASDLGTASDENLSAEVIVYNPANTNFTRVSYQGNYTSDAPLFIHFTGGGMRRSAADVDAIRFLMDSGNIASGNISVFGLKD